MSYWARARNNSSSLSLETILARFRSLSFSLAGLVVTEQARCWCRLPSPVSPLLKALTGFTYTIFIIHGVGQHAACARRVCVWTLNYGISIILIGSIVMKLYKHTLQWLHGNETVTYSLLGHRMAYVNQSSHSPHASMFVKAWGGDQG